MKWLLTVLFFMSAAGSCEAALKDWTEKERKLYHSYLALSAVDTYQTFKMIDCQNVMGTRATPHCTIQHRNN